MTTEDQAAVKKLSPIEEVLAGMDLPRKKVQKKEASEAEAHAVNPHCRCWKVGDVVYPAYTPGKAGRIVHVQHQIVVAEEETYATMPEYTVRQANGKEWKSSTVSPLAELLEDHKRKAEKLEKMLRELSKEIHSGKDRQ